MDWAMDWAIVGDRCPIPWGNPLRNGQGVLRNRLGNELPNRDRGLRNRGKKVAGDGGVGTGRTIVLSM